VSTAASRIGKEVASMEHRSPNNRMQRGGLDKVLRRGLDSSPRKIFMRARVREALCPRADAGRSATLS
jgi:hypothetical protein